MMSNCIDFYDVILFFEKSNTKDDWLGRTRTAHVVIPVNFKPEKWSMWFGKLIRSQNKRFYYFIPYKLIKKLNVQENESEIKKDIEFLRNTKNEFKIKEIYPPEIPPERVGVEKCIEIEWK